MLFDGLYRANTTVIFDSLLFLKPFYRGAKILHDLGRGAKNLHDLRWGAKIVLNTYTLDILNALV